MLDEDASAPATVILERLGRAGYGGGISSDRARGRELPAAGKREEVLSGEKER